MSPWENLRGKFLSKGISSNTTPKKPSRGGLRALRCFSYLVFGFLYSYYPQGVYDIKILTTLVTGVYGCLFITFFNRPTYPKWFEITLLAFVNAGLGLLIYKFVGTANLPHHQVSWVKHFFENLGYSSLPDIKLNAKHFSLIIVFQITQIIFSLNLLMLTGLE